MIYWVAYEQGDSHLVVSTRIELKGGMMLHAKLFYDRDEAEEAVAALRRRGISSARILEPDSTAEAYPIEDILKMKFYEYIPGIDVAELLGPVSSNT